MTPADVVPIFDGRWRAEVVASGRVVYRSPAFASRGEAERDAEDWAEGKGYAVLD